MIRGKRGRRRIAGAVCAGVLGLLLWAEAPARAQAAPTASDRGHGNDLDARALSLEDALALADERAERVRLARAAVREAEARVVGTGIILPVNPRLSADARPPVTGGGLRDAGYSVTGEISFDLGGAPAARGREAERGASLARATLEVSRRDARAEAWAAYVRAKAAEMRLADAEASERVGERVLRAARLRGDLGASGDIDESVATLEAAERAAATEEARRALASRLMDLREALDLRPGEALALTTALEDPPPAADASLLVSRALAARPELREIRARFGLLDATDERLRREVNPRVGFYGGVDAAPLSPIFGVVGVSLELPVAQRNQGPLARVARERETESVRLELQVRRIEREVVARRADYAARLAELVVLRDRALPAAERALALVETGWRAGRFDVFRMTAAARELVRARGRRLEALEGAWLERVALDRAVGGGGA